MDPIRPNIKEAIEKCKVAGINVRMVTGSAEGGGYYLKEGGGGGHVF